MHHWLGTPVGNMVLPESVMHIFKKVGEGRKDDPVQRVRGKGWPLSGKYQKAVVEAVCRLIQPLNISRQMAGKHQLRWASCFTMRGPSPVGVSPCLLNNPFYLVRDGRKGLGRWVGGQEGWNVQGVGLERTEKSELAYLWERWAFLGGRFETILLKELWRIHLLSSPKGGLWICIFCLWVIPRPKNV